MAAILLLFLYHMIFSFSEQDGETSGSLSYFISEKCVELFNSLSGRHWTDVFMSDLAAYFEHPIRKLAHFTEYACMGMLVFLLWRPWRKASLRLGILTIIWVFASALGDEIHQYFVPGRYSSFADVCLDTLGGAFGLLVCLLLEGLFRRRRTASCTRKQRACE